MRYVRISVFVLCKSQRRRCLERVQWHFLSQHVENAITFDRDVSPFEMNSAQDLDRMFYNASSYNPNLCSWMTSLPQDASVTDTFVGTSCPGDGDPDLFVMPVNPLCYNECTLDVSSVRTMSPGGGGGDLPLSPHPVWARRPAQQRRQVEHQTHMHCRLVLFW